MRVGIAALLTVLAGMLPAALPDKPLAQGLLGWPLTPAARTQLADALAAHPGCDLLYQPLFKARDPQAFKAYFRKAGMDGWVLLYLLRERDTYQPELAGAHMDPMKLLARLLWASKAPSRENLCPWPGPLQTLTFDGYSDELTDECYAFTLTYRMDGEPGNLTLSWCNPFDREAMPGEAARLFEQAGVPHLHRGIVQNRTLENLKPLPGTKKPSPTSRTD